MRSLSIRYFSRVILVVVVLSLPFIANIIFLYQADELTLPEKAVHLQMTHPVLYGSSFMASAWPYKLALAAEIHADVIALGSSRVSMLRDVAFKKPFLNAGVATHSTEESRQFLERLFDIYKPSVVILSIDPVWFSPLYEVPTSFPEHTYRASDLSRYKLLSPFKWLATGKMSLRDYINIIRGQKHTDDRSDYHYMGVQAMELISGYRRDGSYLYGAQVSGQRPDMTDPHFIGSFEDLHLHRNAFIAGAMVDSVRYQAFVDLLKLCRQKGCHPVLFLSPIARSLQQSMDRDPQRYGYVKDLDQKLRELHVRESIEYYNPDQLRPAMANDCEFLDGTHLGEVGFYRVLNVILSKNPSSILAGVVDINQVNRIISTSGGHAMIPGDQGHVQFKEGDFLQLGCPKAG